MERTAVRKRLRGVGQTGLPHISHHFPINFDKEKRKKGEKNKKESHIKGGLSEAVKVFEEKILPLGGGDFFCKIHLDLESRKVQAARKTAYFCGVFYLTISI